MWLLVWIVVVRFYGVVVGWFVDASGLEFLGYSGVLAAWLLDDFVGLVCFVRVWW